jgi:uncharacterized protein
MTRTYSNHALEEKSPQYAYALVILSGGLAFAVSQLGAPLPYWLVYALLAALFGSIWPHGSWQWGGWLCLPILLLLCFDFFVTGSASGLLNNAMILAKALPSACLGAYVGSKLSVRKLATHYASRKQLSSNGNGAQDNHILHELTVPLASVKRASTSYHPERPVRMIAPGASVNGHNAALIKAAQEGDIDGIKALVADGANVNSQSGDSWTPLMIAALEGEVETIETLFGKGAVLDASSGKGWTALMIATIEGHLEVVRTLLEHGAQVNAENDKGWTALRFAVSMDETEILRLLIEKGADVNIADREGKTALMQAAGENLEESVQAILDAGADPFIKDRNEQTALLIAQKYGHTRIVKLLREKEAKTSTRSVAPASILDGDDSYFYLLKEKLEEKLNSRPDSYATEETASRPLDATKRQHSLAPSEISHKLMLTLQEAATLSGLPRQHLLEAIEEGKLKAQLLEHAWRIKRADLNDYIRRLG